MTRSLKHPSKEEDTNLDLDATECAALARKATIHTMHGPGMQALRNERMAGSFLGRRLRDLIEARGITLKYRRIPEKGKIRER
jgi:hypothetical protein